MRALLSKVHGRDMVPVQILTFACGSQHPDVAAAGVDAYEHYVQTGRFEHRRVT